MADENEQPLDEELDSTETTVSTGANDDLARKDALIAKLRKENGDKRIKAREAEDKARALESQLAKVDTVSQTVEQMKAELEAEKAARRQAELNTLKLQVATTVGLPPELAARLNGSTLEELTTDAQSLAGVLPKGALVVPKVGQGAPPPPISRAREIHSRISGTSNDVFNPDTNIQLGGGIFKGE